MQPHVAQADADPHAAAAEDDEPEEAASIAVARSIDVPGRGVVTMHELTMPDRSRAGNRETRWLLQAQLESAIYGCEGNSTGAFYKLLQRCSLLGTVLSVDKRAVVAGHVLQPEYDEIMRCLATPQARKVRPQRRGTSLSLARVSPPTTCLAPRKRASASSLSLCALRRTLCQSRSRSAPSRASATARASAPCSRDFVSHCRGRGSSGERAATHRHLSTIVRLARRAARLP